MSTPSGPGPMPRPVNTVAGESVWNLVLVIGAVGCALLSDWGNTLEVILFAVCVGLFITGAGQTAQILYQRHRAGKSIWLDTGLWHPLFVVSLLVLGSTIATATDGWTIVPFLGALIVFLGSTTMLFYVRTRRSG